MKGGLVRVPDDLSGVIGDGPITGLSSTGIRMGSLVPATAHTVTSSSLPLKTSQNGRRFIEAFEGKILRAYDDHDDHVVRIGEHVQGTLTIGYGHTSAAGPPRVYVGMVISEADADAILSSDLTSVEIEVRHLVHVPLSQNQLDALVSFQFNTGWLAHPSCTLLRVLNTGNYNLAMQDFGLYDRAEGRVISGLVRRRRGEAQMFAGKVQQALSTAGSTAAVA